MYIKVFGVDPWAPVIEDAVSKCDFDASKNFSNKLTKFYKCADELILKNCPVSAIDGSEECDPVQEYYEKCMKFKANCSVYPMNIILPEFCCDYPEMISPKVVEACKTQCKAEPLIVVKVKCQKDCVDKQLKVKNMGKYDFNALKKVLMANANTSAAWEMSIEKSVESCKKDLDGLILDENQLDAALKKCLKETLSDNCAVYKTGDVSCLKLKRYKKECPDSKPNRVKPPKPTTKKPATTEETPTHEETEKPAEATTEVSEQKLTEKPTEENTITEESH